MNKQQKKLVYDSSYKIYRQTYLDRQKALLFNLKKIFLFKNLSQQNQVFICFYQKYNLIYSMNNFKKLTSNLRDLQLKRFSSVILYTTLQTSALSKNLSFAFSTIENEKQNSINNLSFQGYLQIRNSQMLALKLTSYQGDIQLLLNKNATMNDLVKAFNQKLQTQNCKILCHQGIDISPITPIQALLNRMFFILPQNAEPIKVQGQFLHSLKDKDQSIQLLKNIELPLITRRQIQQYFRRIDIWLQSKYGEGLEGNKVNVSTKQIKSIAVQALRDRRNSIGLIQQIEDQHQRLYWQILNMKDKKQQALVYCNKIVRNRLMGGLVLIAANTGFIWSGTYLFFSWDIIEPMAYFISSFSGIALTAQFFKLKKPFTNLNYREYMINKYSERAYKKFNLDINELQIKEKRLQQLQSIIKDYYLSKL